ETLPFLGTCVAEIGAGLGTITELLVRKHLKGDSGTKLEVFEPAGNLYERLQEKLRSQFPGLIQAGRLKTTKGSLQPSPLRFDTIVLINVLGKSTAINRRLARIYDRWFVPFTRWVEDRCGAVIGKNILMVGRKSEGISV